MPVEYLLVPEVSQDSFCDVSPARTAIVHYILNLFARVSDQGKRSTREGIRS